MNLDSDDLSEEIALSTSQNQIWLDLQSFPNCTYLNTGGLGYIHGTLNVELFTRCVSILIRDNIALRLKILNNGQQQVVSHWPNNDLSFYDFSHLDNPNQHIKLAFEETLLHPVNLHQRPWQISLYKANETNYGLMFNCHHIIMDGFGIALIAKKLSRIYNQLLAVQPVDEPDLCYLDFIKSSHDYLLSQAYKKDQQYWLEMFPYLPTPIFNKRHYTSNSHTLAKANNSHYFIKAGIYADFSTLAKQYSGTTYHLFIAALSLYFCRVNNKKQITFGLPVLNRSGKRYKSVLGMFTTMVPLRICISKTDTVQTLLVKVINQSKSAYRHARYPMSHLSQHLKLLKNKQYGLFDIVLSFEAHSFILPFGQSTLSTPKQSINMSARHPLAITICEFSEGEDIEILVESSCDYFSLNETNGLTSTLPFIMSQMLEKPKKTTDTIQILSDTEQKSLIEEKHQHVIIDNEPIPYLTNFEHLALTSPNKLALTWLSGEMSYQTLNHNASIIAEQLDSLKVKKGDVIAVIMPRLPITIATLLAINKVRAIFLPVDPELPQQRINQLITLSNAIHCMVLAENKEQFSYLEHLVSVDINHYHHGELPTASEFQVTQIQHQDLAYILFTSGTTGEPKGVLVSHGALSRRLKWLERTFKYTNRDIALQSIALNFDPAMIEIFLPLTVGATVALTAPGNIAPNDLAKYASQLAVTSIIFIPTTLRYFNQTISQFPDQNLRIAISGGEILYADLASSFVAQTGAQLYNLYGPTEACIFATACHYDIKKHTSIVPIGKPVDDTRIYILDNNLNLLPEGCIGEIYIGGQALANGYLAQPKLNKQQFLADPFNNGLMYKTGDNAYWDQNGNIQFINRKDSQIKRHGYRIEPSEIELALCGLPDISACAIKYIKNELHAWLVTTSLLTEEKIKGYKSHLSQTLPSAMIPQKFSQINKMPYQSSGKINYHNLIENPISIQVNTAKVNTNNAFELQLITLWKTCLGISNVSYNCDFFELGGDSISALNLLSLIEQKFGYPIALSLLVENPTVALFSLALQKNNSHLMLNISGHSKGNTIYLLASGHGDIIRFKSLAPLLGCDYHLQVLQPPLMTNDINKFEQLAKLYAHIIEQNSCTQSIFLAGFSIGGITALETARILKSKGYKMEKLILIDSTYPSFPKIKSLLWHMVIWLIKQLKLQELSLNSRTLKSLIEDQGLTTQIHCLKNYNVAPLDIPTLLIISSGFNTWHRYMFKPWYSLQKNNLQEQHLTGFHGSIFTSDKVKNLAKILTCFLAKKP